MDYPISPLASQAQRFTIPIMELMQLKFDWLGRLGRVILVIVAILLVPFSYLLGQESNWSGPLSFTFLYTAIALSSSYIFLVLAAKTVLYIAKGENFLRAGFKPLHYLLLVLPVVLFLIVALVFYTIIEPSQRRSEKETFEREYQMALSEMDALRESFRTCAAPVMEEAVKDAIRLCNLRKGKVKNDYDFCVSLTSINSPTSCLYEHDYESIDCSEETIRPLGEGNVSKQDLSLECQKVYEEAKAAKTTIDLYEQTIGRE